LCSLEVKAFHFFDFIAKKWMRKPLSA
jgi:hypothetical protein